MLHVRSPTQRSVVTGSTDGHCRVYGFAGGPYSEGGPSSASLAASWRAHAGNVDAMAALLAGQFATLGSEGTLKTWTLAVRPLSLIACRLGCLYAS